MNPYNAINEVLVGLFRDILAQEERNIITEEFKDITVNDMHIIESIGIHEPKNITRIAKESKVTVGTMTTAINNLVKKGYAQKIKSETDRRMVYITLSEKGIKAYEHHAKFHKDMTDEVIAQLSEEEIEIVVKALKGISNYFELKES